MLCFFLLWVPSVLFAQGGLPSEPYIYVEGKAQITREPDIVTLGFTLGVRDANQTAAGEQMRVQAAKVFALLDGEKIAEKDVVAESIRSEPEYRDDSETETRTKEAEHKILAHHVTRPFSVVVREVAAFPKLVDQLLALGVEKFTDISPGLTQQDELTRQVRAQALIDARSQAEETLKVERKAVSAVYAISPVPIPQISGQLLVASGSEDAVYPAFVSAPRKLDPTQYRLAPIEVSQTVHVIYLIKDAPSSK